MVIDTLAKPTLEEATNVEFDPIEGDTSGTCDLKQSTGGSIDWSTEGYFPYVR